MEISAVAGQANALRAYAAQRQEQQRSGEAGEARRPDAEAAATATGDRVSLSRESRLLAVQQAGQAEPQDELRRSFDPRALADAQNDRANVRVAVSPRTIAQALAAYSSTALT